jgi:Oxidoreductase molybdopterin binding domain
VSLNEISTPGRLAEPGDGISAQELAMAARNHGMPLEAMRYDLTPPGLHYLLVHYDIPYLDGRSWRLKVDGLVGRPLILDLAALQALPARTVRVDMECAGNGRARLEPRPISQPWLVEAVGAVGACGRVCAQPRPGPPSRSSGQVLVEPFQRGAARCVEARPVGVEMTTGDGDELLRL